MPSDAKQASADVISKETEASEAREHARKQQADELKRSTIEYLENNLANILKEALTYPGDDRPALVARIPVICNDVRWIKRALIGLYIVLGTVLATQLAAHITL